ncbi:Type I restriction enzyme R protein N terminus (HSDR_N) [Chitinophaga costaii]|uniref:Type I restriction enzyme R protein N terminus (HSDR_N) n=1 Tax=Chitinophaga costaii TaxID=1335309 RepID=A0A1C3ZZ23_9BACT|nr:type I restriction enzyme HsdR N-terminal domain-containing protein [Chitinophaga costaii]PUZ30565.1 restriction endonuclease subunit R [Chitinophaga costaii]SCB87583.1 Type I restriction enzyme R protein N terminus (HSDR_N) [Chitinophaga costaii]
MIAITFPTPNFKIQRQDGKELIFDAWRKKYVVLTPEEWVRQNFLAYLTQTLQYPASLIGIEKELMLGTLRKRCDIVVYNRQMQPWMIVECKEMTIPLGQLTLEQINRYQMVLSSSYLVITNGVNTFCCYGNAARQQWEFVQALPSYPFA